MTARAHQRTRPKLRRYSKGFWRGLVINRIENDQWIADQHNGRTTTPVETPNRYRQEIPLAAFTGPTTAEVEQYPSEFARLGYTLTDGEVVWEAPSDDEWHWRTYRYLLECYCHGAPLRLIIRAIRLHVMTGADAGTWDRQAHRAVKPTQQLQRAITDTNCQLVDWAFESGFSPDLVALPEYCDVADCEAITYDQGETFHIVGTCLATTTTSHRSERCEARPPPNPRLVPCRPNGPTSAAATRSKRVCVSAAPSRAATSHARLSLTGGSR